MYAGRIVEQAPAARLFGQVRMPYTQALFEAIPRLERPAHAPLPVIGGGRPTPRRDAAGLLVRAALPPRRRRLPGRRAAAGRARARPPLGLLAPRGRRRPVPPRARPCSRSRDLVHEFPHRRRHRARRIRRVLRRARRGRRWASWARPVPASRPWPGRSCRRPGPRRARSVFRGADLVTLRGTRLLQARRHLQMVFQDPFGSLDPKWRVRRPGRGAADRLPDGRPEASAQARGRGARAGRPGPAGYGTGGPGSCPAARPSGSPSPARWPSTRR